MLIETPQFMVLLLVLMRMSGFILLNPFLNRQGIPAVFRVGLTLLITAILFPAKAAYPVEMPNSALVLGVTLLLEFSIGAMVAFIIELFFFALGFAGGIIDFQMGMTMAKAYDPMTNTTAGMTGGLFSTFFYLFFFAVDGHLALIRIFMTADRLVPFGQVVINRELAQAALTLFCECAVLGVKLAFPFIAMEFLVEAAVGIMTKVIPQVNIFVINIQIKIIVGMLMLIILCTPISEYINNIVIMMIREIQSMIRVMGG